MVLIMTLHLLHCYCPKEMMASAVSYQRQEPFSEETFTNSNFPSPLKNCSKCMNASLAGVPVRHMWALFAEVRRGCRIPRTGIPDSCESLSDCWELSQGPVGERPVLKATEPSL